MSLNNKIKYTILPNSKNGYRSVHVSYFQNERKYEQLVYVKDNPKFKDKDYIREAKKDFKPNFKFQAHPRAYPHFPVIPVAAAIVIAGGLGAGGYFTYKYLTTTPVTNTCVVNFDSDGGSYVASKRVNKGKAFDAPENPIKQVDTFSYTFEGWFLNDTKFDFTIGTTIDITLKAHWSGTPPVPPGSCIVNFDSDGGSYVASKIVTKGEPFDKPTPDPTKIEGDFPYQFGGWYLGAHEFVFGTDTVNDTTTLKAHWNGTPPPPTESYIVTFTGADCSATRGGTIFTSDLVEKNSSLTLIISPKETTHFELDNTITVLLNGGTPLADYYTYEKDGDTPNYVLNIPKVTGKTEILASTTEYCYVSYVLPEPLTKEPAKIKKGEVFGESLAPLEIENYSFVGWYYDEEFQNECIPTLKIFEDTTVYGRVLKGDINMPLTFVCQSDGEASIKLNAQVETFHFLPPTTTKNLKYKIITATGTEGDWKPIDGADDSGNFSFESSFTSDILQRGDTLNKGDQIQFKGDNDCFSKPPDRFGGYLMSFSTGTSTENKFDLKGNVMSLLSSENFATLNVIDSESCFTALFSPLTTDEYCNIVDASNLVLPATSLSANCYSNMFASCASLTNAPNLLAQDLNFSCYSSMFSDCTSLTIAPELPATTLAPSCYNSMFYNCTSLTQAPELPSTTLDFYCYQNMFDGCSNLTIAPELPATTLVPGCYYCMFSSCVKLEYLKVGFGTPGSDEWPAIGEGEEAYDATIYWLGFETTAGSEAANTPQFHWKGSKEVTWTRDTDHVPDLWAINTYTD